MLRKAMHAGIRKYIEANSSTKIVSTEFTLGGVHTTYGGMYVFAFIADRVLFNLLVKRSEEGEDLFEMVCETKDGKALSDRVA